MLDRRSSLLTPLPLEGDAVRRYAIALLGMALALALRAIFQPILGGSMHYVSVSAATVFAAWYCGIGPAVVATIAGTCASNLLFYPPYTPWGRLTERDVIGELLFLAFCAAIIVLGETARSAVLRLEHVRGVLQRSRINLKLRIRQRTSQLAHSNQSLRDLSVRLLRVQDDERRRIARDLHDSTGQALTALKLELAGIERELSARDPEIARRVAAVIGDARQISDELRTISYLLHPPLLDELGLSSALRWYADGFEKRSGIKVHLECTGLGRLAPEMETAMFRVVQECLINVHRHSGSATASILIRQTAQEIVLEVQDQGCGIAADELSEIAAGVALGVGTRGMTERIRDLGGEMEIISSEKGTKVKAVIPIEPCDSRAFAEEDARVVSEISETPALGAIAKRAAVN